MKAKLTTVLAVMFAVTIVAAVLAAAPAHATQVTARRSPSPPTRCPRPIPTCRARTSSGRRRRAATGTSTAPRSTPQADTVRPPAHADLHQPRRPDPAAGQRGQQRRRPRGLGGPPQRQRRHLRVRRHPGQGVHRLHRPRPAGRAADLRRLGRLAGRSQRQLGHLRRDDRPHDRPHHGRPGHPDLHRGARPDPARRVGRHRGVVRHPLRRSRHLRLQPDGRLYVPGSASATGSRTRSSRPSGPARTARERSSGATPATPRPRAPTSTASTSDDPRVCGVHRDGRPEAPAVDQVLVVWNDARSADDRPRCSRLRSHPPAGVPGGHRGGLAGSADDLRRHRRVGRPCATAASPTCGPPTSPRGTRASPSTAAPPGHAARRPAWGCSLRARTASSHG